MNHSKLNNTKENLSKSSWRQEWLTNLKLISVSLIDEFPSNVSRSDRQTINDNMQILRDIFVNKFKSAISNNFRECDIIILKGEIEDYPGNSEVKILYNQMQGKTGPRRPRFWSLTKTQKFISNMGFEINKPHKPVSQLNAIKSHEVVPQQVIDDKFVSKDEAPRLKEKQPLVKKITASLSSNAKSPIQKNATIAKMLPEEKQINNISNYKEGELAIENDKVTSKSVSLFSPSSEFHDRRNVEDNRVISTDGITDSSITDSLSSADSVGTQPPTSSYPTNTLISNQKRENEAGDKYTKIERSGNMEEDSLSFVDIALSRTASILDEKEKQLTIANDIIRSLSDEIMRDEIKITSLRGDLIFTKRCLENARNQISEKDSRINKLIQRILKKRRR